MEPHTTLSSDEIRPSEETGRITSPIPPHIKKYLQTVRTLRSDSHAAYHVSRVPAPLTFGTKSKIVVGRRGSKHHVFVDHSRFLTFQSNRPVLVLICGVLESFAFFTSSGIPLARPFVSIMPFVAEEAEAIKRLRVSYSDSCCYTDNGSLVRVTRSPASGGESDHFDNISVVDGIRLFNPIMTSKELLDNLRQGDSLCVGFFLRRVVLHGTEQSIALELHSIRVLQWKTNSSSM